MKYTIVLILIFGTLLFSCRQNPEGFVIEAQIEGMKNGTAVVKRRINSEFMTIDSTMINNNTFRLSGKLIAPEMCYIHLNDTLPYIRLFVENKKITVKAHIDSLREAKIEGSETQNALEAYNHLLKPFDERLRSIYQQYSKATMANDTEKIDRYEKEFNTVSDEQKATSLEFVNKNSNNVLGPYLIWGTLAYDLELEELEKLASQFSPEISNSIYVQQINEYITTLKNVAIGKPFSEITLPGPDGKIKKLSDLKGKIILVDFWASWCGPCRRENPNVVAMYNGFKEENFEIFGVSFDENKEKWVKAIEDDELNWKHVSDLKGWNSEAGKIYGVRSIPHTVLINREGIIVDKNLRGDVLRKRIEELLQS